MHFDAHQHLPGENHRQQPSMDVPPSLLPTVLNRLGLENQQSSSAVLADELLKALRHSEWYVRAAAVRRLERLGKQAPFELLLPALQDEHESVRAAAVHAVSALGNRAPVDRLVSALHDPAWHVRETAALALGTLGVNAPIDSLLKALDDSDAMVRDAATYALDQVDAATKEGEGMKEIHSSPVAYSGHSVSSRKADESRLSRWAHHPAWRVIGLGLAALLILANILAWIVITQQLHRTKTGSDLVPSRTLGMTLYTYRSSTYNLVNVAWSPDGKHLAIGGSDAQVLDASAGKLVLTREVAISSTGGVQWSPDGTKIVSSCTKGIVWDPRTGQVLATFVPQSLSMTHAGGGPLAQYASPSSVNEISASVWSPDGRYIASAVNGNVHNVQVWNAATGELLFVLQSNAYANFGGQIRAVAWSPDGTRIAFSGDTNTVEVWDVATRQHLLTYAGHSVSVGSLAWSPDSTRIASAGNDVHVWNATSSKTLFTYQSPSSGFWASQVAWSPDGTRIAAAGNGLQIWNANTGQHLFTYTGYGPNQYTSISALSWSPDSNLIASLGGGGSINHTINVWVAG